MSESQEQLEAAKTETQKQSKELALVRRDPGNALLCPWGWLAKQLWGKHPSSGLREGRKAQHCMGLPGAAGDHTFRGDCWDPGGDFYLPVFPPVMGWEGRAARLAQAGV